MQEQCIGRTSRRRVLILAALFCFYSCLLHSNCFKGDDAILHHMAGKDFILLLQSCKELNQGVRSREGEKICYS